MQKGQGGGDSENDEYIQSIDKVQSNSDHHATIEPQNNDKIHENSEKPKNKKRHK